MSKTIWFVSVSILTLFAAGSSLRSSVSETVSGTPLTLAVADLERNADRSMPVMKINDMSFVFAGTE